MKELTAHCEGDEYGKSRDRSFRYTEGDEVRIDSDPPVKKKYTITLDLNGGELNGVTGVIAEQHYEGEVIKLPEPSREGYEFDYWKGSAYKAGQKYKVEEDHTFTAQWEKISDDPDDPSKKDGSGTRGAGTNICLNGLLLHERHNFQAHSVSLRVICARDRLYRSQ